MDKEFFYKEYRQGRRFILKILPGVSLVKSLSTFVAKENVHYATVLSAIGSVRDVRMRGIKAGAKLPITPARVTPVTIEGPFELLALTGNLVPDHTGQTDCHLHIMVSKSNCEVMGGHMDDAEVFATCEIVLIEQLVEGVERFYSKAGGISTLYIEGEVVP
jgi:predicted DNA-binding protein with PD1-like motif